MRALLVGLVLLSGLLGCASVSRVERGGIEVITITHDNTNVHVVKQGQNAFLFDSGYEKNTAKLEADLRSAGIDPAKLKAVVVSHAHADHAGGARYFKTTFNVPVVLGSGDESMFGKGENEPLCPTGLIGSIRHAEDQAGKYVGSTADVFVTGTLELKELTGIDAKAILVPGHTRGSVVVTVGDLLLVGDLFRGSIGGYGAAMHFFMCDVEENKRNINKVMTEIAPRTSQVFVGHFGPVSAESVRSYFDVK
ncbi:MAG: MBL fold metallo-hydrolase [Archangium sp.]|nr:MBL fold metallo-hydrolase [Archangium sp.]